MKKILVILTVFLLAWSHQSKADEQKTLDQSSQCAKESLKELVDKSEVVLLGKFIRHQKFNFPDQLATTRAGIAFDVEKSWKKTTLSKVIIGRNNNNKVYQEISEEILKKGNSVNEKHFLVFSNKVIGPWNKYHYDNLQIILVPDCNGLQEVKNPAEIINNINELSKGE